MNKKPIKLKTCTECGKNYPTLCKTRIKEGKKESFCYTCWPKVQKKEGKEKKEKQKQKRRTTRENKRNSLPYLTKQLDIVFSQYIRHRDADSNGMCTCIDGCGQLSHWKSTDCGHFASRRCMSTRWHEQNCAAQHKACNGPVGLGRQYEFGKGLDLKFGEGTADKIIALSKQTKKWTPEELKEMIQLYTEKLNSIL